MVQLRREIATFNQMEGESFQEAWEHFKMLIQRCLHHELAEWLRLQMFYNRLDAQIKKNEELTSTKERAKYRTRSAI
ncbi:Retrotransposon gag protein [Gossypium australe]|uniref:Retrotransposon gag protein n=1 Tax=Gossypium australe TaxID=47621 RepID=A0A5B6VKK2_9ROSI|nr:Retrotransposon gag protein [Gossypium australe]